MHINVQQNRSSRLVKTMHTNLFAKNRKLHKFAACNSNFEKRSFQISAIDASLGIVKGRPYGGMAILVRKRYRSIIVFQQYKDPRILGITVKSKSELFFFSLTYICLLYV